jgi:hypothetical protein
MKTRMLSLLAIIGLVAIYATPAYATTYFGPSFAVTSTSPGGNVYITVSTNSSNTFVSPPEGSGAQCQTGQQCNFPLQACTNSSTFYYSIHSITISDAVGNTYMLGSSVTSGMYWPASLGGQAPGPNTNSLSSGTGSLGDALNVTTGDSFVLPFGPGAGGFTFTTSLTSPPQTHTPEGPYYWWTVAGNQYGSNLRLDQNPQINPTLTPGTYVADIEGVVICGTGVFFDQGIQVFFDSGHQFTVPQFSVVPVLGVVAASLMGIALLRKSGRLLPPTAVSNGQ